MAQFATGSDATLHALVIDEFGDPFDAESVTVDVYDPANVHVVTAGVATHDSLGAYTYVFAVPEDALLGDWRIDWTINISDTLISYGTEDFTIVSPGEVETDINAATRLRSRLSENKTDPDGDGSETFFTDDEIADLLSYTNGDLNQATYEGWLRKSARFSRLVDIAESGSERKLSQKFKQTQAMAAHWAKIAGEGADVRSDALRGAVVGRAFSLRECPELSTLTPFSGATDWIHEYPTHRLLIPSILS